MILSFDTETTGVDFWHSSRPFFVSTCDENGTQRYWAWDVNPYTREVDAKQEDLDEIWGYLSSAERIVGQNIRFDVHGMTRLDKRFAEWPWNRTDDTLIMAHVLDSAALKDLTSLCVRFLDADIEPYEKELEVAVKAARTICRRKEFIEEHGEWRIASEDDSELPSAKGARTWASDYWLPKELYDRFDWVRDDHPNWGELLTRYGNVDTAVLSTLSQRMLLDLDERSLTPHYRSRMEILPVLWRMEEDGVTVNKNNLHHLEVEYGRTSVVLNEECLSIASGLNYDLQMPKGASPNDSLRTFMFDVLKVPKIYAKKAKSDAPTLDKGAMTAYLETLPEDGVALRFVRALTRKRKRDTSLSYMTSYQRYWRETGHDGTMRLHPSINPVGTDVTRRSSSNPNEQNISAKKDDEGLSLRYAFGPAPGREWWSMDYENIELRIPAYEADERAMIDLFEDAESPPYFGSNHLLCAHILWPKEFEECLRTGESFKDKYVELYKRTKNGNFAVQYGAMEQSGTADRAYGQVGAQRKIQERLGRINDLNRRMIDHANRHGFVYTMPDKTVDPTRGYPVTCPRGEYGRVRPTTPLSYHIQGTAGWCTGKALIRTSAQIEEWNRLAKKRNYWIVMEVHDELVFDFPAGGRKNLLKVNRLKQLMIQSGDDIGVPLKVSVSYHPSNWAEEVECI